jgi:hypothetical protein
VDSRDRQWINCRLVAITRKLDKLDETTSREIEGHVTFQIASILSDESLDLLQAQYAIDGAIKRVEDMKSPPSGLEASQQAVDSSGEAKEAIVSEANPWLPLLDSLELFVKAVDDIAEVRVVVVDCFGLVVNDVLLLIQIHPYAKMAWSLLTFVYKVFLSVE